MSTVWGAGDFEVLAATLIRPRPLYRTFVPLDAGLSVLYGRNGAGKSRVLEGLQAAVTGMQGRAWAWLHVRVKEALEQEPGEGLTGALLKALGESSSGRGLLADRVAAALVAAWEHSVVDAEGLAAEVANAGVLSLLPVGVPGTHAWRVWASSLPGEDTPLLTERASEYRRDWLGALLIEGEEQREEAVWEAHERFGLMDEPADAADPVPFETGHPVLLVELGTVVLPGPLVDLYGPPAGDLDGATLHRLLHRDGPRRPFLVDGTDQIRQDIGEDIAHLTERATDLYALVLEHAPSLRCVLAPVEQWLTAPALRWVADDADGTAGLALDELSQAQKRWAEIAIGAALTEFTAGDGRALMLLDEPELALHSLAVRTMAEGLQQLAGVINVDIVAATHAAALLEPATANLLHVQRDYRGVTAVHRMPRLDQAALDGLGMTKADYLQLTRTFVVVEGVHDRIVLQETCGDELAKARAAIVELRGAPNAPSLLDAQFMLRFTDADFLVVLDALQPEHVDDVWLRARTAYRDSGVDSARTVLKEGLPGSLAIENKYLRELMLTALDTGQDRRVRFRPLSLPDVVYYLPIESFTAARTSWKELAEEHAASSTKLSYKDWLIAQKTFDFGDQALIRAAHRLDHLHDDLAALAREISRGRPAAATAPGTSRTV